MPPKKAQAQVPNKKTVEKKKDKVIEDKTFGIKNKKGKKQQVFIKQVTNQVKYGGGQSVSKREGDVYQLKKEKADKEKDKSDLESIFKPVHQVQKISAGADPKSVLCLFFKQGLCTKGDKCKFSHDLSLENKAEKRSMYVDSRDDDLANDTMDKWDTDKLEEVIGKKHSATIITKTEIVCKHFLHAIERGVYGWFWECPIGGDKCIYRHALPPGFVLKKHKKEQEEMQALNAITLEELVEKERTALASSGKPQTKVTLESFLAWKKRKLKDKKVKSDKEMAKKKEAFKQGRTLGISGREVFLFNPELVGGDDDDSEGGAVFQVEREKEEDPDEAVVDITDIHAAMATRTPEVRTEGETSGLSNSNEGSTSRGGASDEGIAVDEGLFQEDFDDLPGGDSGVTEALEGEEGEVAVDESLFDVEDLQDLILDDPTLLEVGES